MTCWDNSCETCVVASDDNKCNGYLDLQCNIKRLVNTPFETRCELMYGFDMTREEIEAKYPCKYHCTKEDYIRLKDLDKLKDVVIS